MNDLNFYWRMGDYALQAVPKCLVRFDKDDKNETIELVKYYQYQGKECLYTIGYFHYNEHEPCWELNFVGDRFKELLETDVVAVFKMLKAAYDVLTEWMEGREENGMRLINADEIAYESIDSSDTEECFSKYGTGILAVRKEDIDKMPSAEPEHIKGHWIVKHGSDAPPICNKCGYESRTTIEKVVDQNCKMIYCTAIDIKSNFCPNCGADMRGEQDDKSRSNSNAQADARSRGMGTTDNPRGI